MLEGEEGGPKKKRRLDEAGTSSPAVAAALASEPEECEVGIDELDGEAEQLLQELADMDGDVDMDSSLMGALGSLWGAYVTSPYHCSCCIALPINQEHCSTKYLFEDLL